METIGSVLAGLMVVQLGYMVYAVIGYYTKDQDWAIIDRSTGEIVRLTEGKRRAVSARSSMFKVIRYTGRMHRAAEYGVSVGHLTQHARTGGGQRPPPDMRNG